MADKALDKRKINKLIGKVVSIISGQHSGRQGVILWIDDDKVRLQTSTDLITVDVAQLDLDT